MSANKSKKFLSIYIKQEIIKDLENGVGVTVLANKFGVAKSTICGIKKKQNKITKWNLIPLEKEYISATQAVQIFEKAIECAENNTSDYENTLVLHKFRDLAIQKVKSARTKQTNVNNLINIAFLT